MIIYGVALLAVCTLAGVIVGDFLGVLLGVKSNVGGVGIAMILLICARLYMHRNGGMSKECEFGVGFWGAMYIPVVVAMATVEKATWRSASANVLYKPACMISAVSSAMLNPTQTNTQRASGSRR